MKTNDMNSINEIDKVVDKDKKSKIGNGVRFVGMLVLLALLAWLLSKLLS